MAALDRSSHSAAPPEHGPNGLQRQAAEELQSKGCTTHGAKPKSSAPIELGDDVTWDTHYIYTAKTPAQVDWLAEDGLNNLVLRSYANGRKTDQVLAAGKLCPQDLTKQQNLELLRYRSLHDALRSRAHDFAKGSNDPGTEARFLNQWEAGFLRPPIATTRPRWF